jgi:hypothetical protein
MQNDEVIILPLSFNEFKTFQAFKTFKAFKAFVHASTGSCFDRLSMTGIKSLKNIEWINF